MLAMLRSRSLQSTGLADPHRVLTALSALGSPQAGSSALARPVIQIRHARVSGPVAPVAGSLAQILRLGSAQLWAAQKRAATTACAYEMLQVRSEQGLGLSAP